MIQIDISVLCDYQELVITVVLIFHKTNTL